MTDIRYRYADSTISSDDGDRENLEQLEVEREHQAENGGVILPQLQVTTCMSNMNDQVNNKRIILSLQCTGDMTYHHENLPSSSAKDSWL